MHLWEGKDHSKRQTIQGLSKLASSQLLTLPPPSPSLITLCEYRCILAELQTGAETTSGVSTWLPSYCRQSLVFPCYVQCASWPVRFSRGSAVSTSCVAIDAHYCVCLLHGSCESRLTSSILQQYCIHWIISQFCVTL